MKWHLQSNYKQLSHYLLIWTGNFNEVVVRATMSIFEVAEHLFMLNVILLQKLLSRRLLMQLNSATVRAVPLGLLEILFGCMLHMVGAGCNHDLEQRKAS